MHSSPLKSKRILLTGSSGFIGIPLLKALEEKGAVVTTLQRQDKGKVDLTNKKLLQATFSGKEFDVAIHLAAFVPKTAEENNSVKNIDVNLIGTMNLFQALEGKIKRFVFASTLDVYGKPKKLPVDEDQPLRPQNSYAESKALAEDYLNKVCSETRIRLTVLRYGNVYGPGERIAKAIPNFVKLVNAGKKPVIVGDGSELRDYIFVQDAVEGTVLAAEKGADGVFNISSGKGVSIRELAEKVIELSGKKIEPEFDLMEKEKFDIVLDVSRAKRELGFTVRTGLDEGLARELERIKCFVFDLDGTLLDYKQRYWTNYRDTLEKHGFRCPSADELYEMRRKGMQPRNILDKILPDGVENRDEVIDEIVAERRACIENWKYLDLDKPLPGILKKLKELGEEADLFVLTLRQNPEDAVKQINRILGEGTFKGVFVSGDNSNFEFKKKVLEDLAKEYGECVFVTDIHEEIEVGKEAGVMTVAVLSGLDGEEILKKSKPDKVIGSIVEL